MTAHSNIRQRSSTTVEFVTSGLRGEWMVVQRMNAEDARSQAYAWDPSDGVVPELLAAAAEVDTKNGDDDDGDAADRG